MTYTRDYTITSIVDVFTQYFDILCPILLHDLYAQLQWCIEQGTRFVYAHFELIYRLYIYIFLIADDGLLAQSGIYCLENLVTSNGPKFEQVNWDCTCQAIALMFESIIPKPFSERNSPFDVCFKIYYFKLNIAGYKILS